MVESLTLSPASSERIQSTARRLVEKVRGRPKGGIDAFLHEYGLSSQEGVTLMCIAEALLRIPDDRTQQALIRDKISVADWERHLGHSESLFVNASTWALMLTGRVVSLGAVRGERPNTVLRRLVTTFGEPVIREATNQAMRIMGRQFVMGRNIDEALTRAQKKEALNYRYSYDMLGEEALTESDAENYFKAYKNAIQTIGQTIKSDGDVYNNPSISIKLSALHPRFEEAQKSRVLAELPENTCCAGHPMA